MNVLNSISLLDCLEISNRHHICKSRILELVFKFGGFERI